MMTIDPTYEAFFQALCDVINRDWLGRKGVLAQEAGISGGFLSDILSRKRRASFKKQNSISIACGYKYEDFLDLGRKLLNKKETPYSQENSSDTDLIKEAPKQEVKVGKKMDQEARDLLQHYKTMIEMNKTMLETSKSEADALRKEIDYLREENRELKRSHKKTSEPSPQIEGKEKKTA